MSWYKLAFALVPLVLVIFNGRSSLALTTSKMEDGDFLKIVNVPTGKVLTISGSSPTEGLPVITSSWSGQSNQKWLVVEALVAGNSFLLMPQQQRYPWARFIRNGGTDPYKNRHDDLPDWTMVLEANTNTGQITQDARDGKLYQQWRAEKIESPTGGKKFLLKNRQNNQCLQGPGQKSASVSVTTTTAAPPTTTTTKKSSFFGNIWSNIRSAFGGSSDNSSARSTRSSTSSTGSTASREATGNNIILAPCDSTDVRQHWQLETLSYEYH